MRLLSLIAAGLCMGCAIAYAQAPLSIITGPKTGTYYAFGQDIARIAKDASLPMQIVDSEGSVDNIKLINYTEGASLGIVQSDVLGFLSRSNNPGLQKILSRLRVVFPLYPEEVHVLARKDIADFKDLQGKKVAVGEDGSGHMLTAVNLFAIEQIVPSDIRKVSPEEAVVEVLRGDLDAMVYVGGKPVKMFKNMEDLSNPEHRKFALLLQQVHFLPMNSAKFYEEYEPAEISHDDYMFVQKTVPTIAVQSALVAIDNHGKDSCSTLKKLAEAVQQNFAALQKSGHPKWREVNLSGEVQGWKKSECVWGRAKR